MVLPRRKGRCHYKLSVLHVGECDVVIGGFFLLFARKRVKFAGFFLLNLSSFGGHFNVFTNMNMCSSGSQLHVVVKFAICSVFYVCWMLLRFLFIPKPTFMHILKLHSFSKQ